MKKRIIIFSTIMLALLLLCFLPIPQGSYDDGGTKEYSALTYKIVKWNKLISVYGDDGNMERVDTYKRTSVYWIPDNFKSIDELWDIENPSNETGENNLQNTIDGPYTVCMGYIIKTETAHFFVSDGNNTLLDKDAFVRIKTKHTDINLDNLQSGDCVRIHVQKVEESYPMQTTIHSIELLDGNASISVNIVAELERLGHKIVK